MRRAARRGRNKKKSPPARHECDGERLGRPTDLLLMQLLAARRERQHVIAPRVPRLGDGAALHQPRML